MSEHDFAAKRQALEADVRRLREEAPRYTGSDVLAMMSPEMRRAFKADLMNRYQVDPPKNENLSREAWENRIKLFTLIVFEIELIKMNIEALERDK